MKKLIGSNWELDLTLFNISETQENSDFTDNLFTKISLPFEIDLTNDLDIAFGFISSYLTSPQTLYNVKYQDGDTIVDAVFEILEEQGGKLQCNYEAGIDEFPSFDKKLSELTLHDFDLPEGVSIYDHAESTLPLTYPAVDYCFPMLHAEFIDTSDELWENFEKIINKRVNNAFIENTIDVAELIYYNRNYMQPLPFWLYLLKKGIEDGGYTLHGDILTDPVLLKKAIFSPRDYYKYIEKTSEFIIQKGSDYNYLIDIISNDPFCFYGKTIPITKKGKYLLQGRINLDYGPNSLLAEKEVSIVFNGTEIYYEDSYVGAIYYINLFLTVNADSTLAYGAKTFNAGEELVIDLELICMVEFDASGDPIPNISNYNRVNLKNAVPDINFSDFVAATRKWRNYSFEPRGKEIWMNKINNAVSLENPVSLEHTEVKEPARKFQQGMSFLLQFIEVDTKDYTWKKVFHNINGAVTDNYKTDSKTNTIEINAIPLPIINKSNITTATVFEKDESKIYAVFYEGLQNSKNVTTDPTEMLLPQAHLDCWYKWIIFRIMAINFKWSYLADEIASVAVKIRDNVYAYKNIHIVKSIIKTQVNQNVTEVEIETESIK
jgi:hypothetical protein